MGLHVISSLHPVSLESTQWIPDGLPKKLIVFFPSKIKFS